MIIKRIILRILLIELGSVVGYMLTLVMFAFQPSLMHMNLTMFIHNIGFLSGYFSSFHLRGRLLAMYFICIYAAVSFIMCIVFYGPTFLCFLNILGYWMTIAGFAIFAMVFVPVIKRRMKDYYDL